MQVPTLLEASSRVSSFPVGPPMFSALANTADSVAAHLLATGLSAAAKSYDHTTLPTLTTPFTYSTACRRKSSCYDRHYHGENEC